MKYCAVFSFRLLQCLMIKQEEGNRAKITIFKKFPKRRNFSTRNSNAFQDKYIIEGETKQIGQVVSTKSSSNKTSIVTFKFVEVPIDFNHRTMNPNKTDVSRKRNVNKQIYMHSVRPLTNNLNLASLRVTSCEVRKLESEICNRRSYKRMNEDYNESCGLEVQGISKNMRNIFNQTNFITKNSNGNRSRMRMTAGSFRVKSHQNNNQLGTHANSIELVDFLRKPNFKKDHFVFGLADKVDSPDNKIEIFRDFLWKANYSNGIFVITPSDNCGYKAFIGKGNNSIMVRGILRRRSWWTVVEDQSQANFSWTQLKLNNFFEFQPSRKVQFSLKDIYSESQISQLESGLPETDEPIDHYSRLFNVIDLKNWRTHYKRNLKTQEKICSSTYMKRVGLLNKKRLFKIDNPAGLRMQNHLIENYYIGNKKALFYNLKRYYDFINQNVFDVVPLTFHITKGVDDSKFADFVETYKKFQEEKKIDKDLKNIWIMKPGENTNRGNGISVCFSLDQIQMRLKSKQRNKDSTLRTFILQKYMEKPLLFHGRKFDIRHYVLITSFAGSMRGYWYQQGYVRTSSYPFSLKNNKDLYVHLTNDAIQKNSENYGKYQSGNKISYQQLQKYILKHSKKQQKTVSFFIDVLPKMKAIALNAIRSTYNLLDPNRKHHNFQLLGLDFMIDDHYTPYLIEVNTNPCLQLSCPLLQSIIPPLIQNTFKLCIDPLFPPPEDIQINKKTFLYNDNHLEDNKFELVFDQLLESQSLKKLFENREKMRADLGKIEEDESQFENDGAENWQEASIS